MHQDVLRTRERAMIGVTASRFRVGATVKSIAPMQVTRPGALAETVLTEIAFATVTSTVHSGKTSLVATVKDCFLFLTPSSLTDHFYLLQDVTSVPSAVMNLKLEGDGETASLSFNDVTVTPTVPTERTKWTATS